MKHLREILSDLLSEYGFSSSTDLLLHLIAYKNAFLFKIQVIVAFIFTVTITITSFIESYLYQPAIGYIVVAVMVFARAISKTAVAMKVHKEKFNPHKFLKTVPILVFHLVILSITWHVGEADKIMSWLPSIIFAYYSTHYVVMLLADGEKLGMIEGKLVSKITSKIETKQDA